MKNYFCKNYKDKTHFTLPPEIPYSMKVMQISYLAGRHTPNDGTKYFPNITVTDLTIC
jgi:hypothetical protein